MEYGNIPTVYSGVRFRSRLEAKWAVFFDIIGWGWHYEQDDVNGWIADFTIDNPFTCQTAFWIEIKPIEGRPPASVQNKILRSGALDDGGCVIVVGKRPFLDDDCVPGGLCFGYRLADPWHKEYNPEHDVCANTVSLLLVSDDGVGWLGCCDQDNDAELLTGKRNLQGFPADDHVDRAWKTACNRVQWKPGVRA
jgi:hypothetical protein